MPPTKRKFIPTKPVPTTKPTNTDRKVRKPVEREDNTDVNIHDEINMEVSDHEQPVVDKKKVKSAATKKVPGKRPAKGRKDQVPKFTRTYPWEEWFSSSHTILVRGEDYDCQSYIMQQMIRNKISESYRSLLGCVSMTIADDGNSLTMTIRDPLSSGKGS